MLIAPVYFHACDGTFLNGLLYQSDSPNKKIVIAVHGMATNCIHIRNDVIASYLIDKDIDYLSFNNRGMALASYFHKDISNSSKQYLSGTSYEEILDCYYDIKGAIEYASSLGYSDIYLQGHSLGATKVVLSYQDFIKKQEFSILKKIKAILLLSLLDIPSIQRYYVGNRFDELLSYAQNLQRSGKQNQLMPEDAFIYPISVKTYLRYAKDYEEINFARFSDPLYDFKQLNEISCPLFFRWGTENEMILQPKEELISTLKKRLTNRSLDLDFIVGANHNYMGKEEVLASHISNFLHNL